ncbi:MAG: adenosylcobalamin-dependent ribonucleoside-diphosphate reductase [Nitrospirae bacterium]|nr:MAG: adenosylcobalamin-dependent ribonucleoside-diphosphate reductase [Nitrospirota bacterium]
MNPLLARPLGTESNAMRDRTHATPRLSANALTVLRRRYLAKNDAGTPVETPTRLFRRVAGNIAQAEHLYAGGKARAASVADSFLRLMNRLDFLPNSPTLMNAGRDLQQLSACFVLPVEDSLESIFEAVKHQALIHQSGGGTGFSFSHLRPKHDRVATTSGVASGPVSFMHVFNMATEVIKQGGTRRGANMGILRVDHPDILEFIQVKRAPTELTNFNLSVGITDAFMRALDRRKDYALVNPRTGRPVARLKAAEVWDRLTEAAWHSGEPGMVFLDTINATNPTPHIGRIEATNPCGEQPLLPYESCTLGSINLARFVTGPATRPRIDFDRLAETIPHAVRFLDDVIDMNRYPLPEIETITKGNRKVGLGVMGFADLLIALGIPYDSEEALTTGEGVMRFLCEQGRAASADLARERGLFPHFKGSRLESEGRRLRNATVTTVAPTGTLSIIADCSPGIEPLYGVSFARTVMEDVHLVTIHPAFLRRARAAGIYSKRLLARVAANESIQNLSEIPWGLRRLFVTAHDVTPEHHVRMQAAFQKYSDSGVSKTINLPHNATQADVASAFRLAYRLGCKGITVFRTGSREKQVLSCANVQYC